MRIIPGVQGWFNTHKEIKVIHHINRLNKKRHTIKSIGAEKAFDKNQQSFMITTLSKLGKEENDLNLIQNEYRKPTVDILLDEGLKAFPLILKTREERSTLIIIIQYIAGSTCHCNMAKKRKRRHTD